MHLAMVGNSLWKILWEKNALRVIWKSLIDGCHPFSAGLFFHAAICHGEEESVTCLGGEGNGNDVEEVVTWSENGECTEESWKQTWGKTFF